MRKVHHSRFTASDPQCGTLRAWVLTVHLHDRQKHGRVCAYEGDGDRFQISVIVTTPTWASVNSWWTIRLFWV